MFFFLTILYPDNPPSTSGTGNNATGGDKVAEGAKNTSTGSVGAEGGDDSVNLDTDGEDDDDNHHRYSRHPGHMYGGDPYEGADELKSFYTGFDECIEVFPGVRARNFWNCDIANRDELFSMLPPKVQDGFNYPPYQPSVGNGQIGHFSFEKCGENAACRNVHECAATFDPKVTATWTIVEWSYAGVYVVRTTNYKEYYCLRHTIDNAIIDYNSRREGHVASQQMQEILQDLSDVWFQFFPNATPIRRVYAFNTDANIVNTMNDLNHVARVPTPAGPYPTEIMSVEKELITWVKDLKRIVCPAESRFARRGGMRGSRGSSRGFSRGSSRGRGGPSFTPMENPFPSAMAAAARQREVELKKKKEAEKRKHSSGSGPSPAGRQSVDDGLSPTILHFRACEQAVSLLTTIYFPFQEKQIIINLLFIFLLYFQAITASSLPAALLPRRNQLRTKTENNFPKGNILPAGASMIIVTMNAMEAMSVAPVGRTQGAMHPQGSNHNVVIGLRTFHLRSQTNLLDTNGVTNELRSFIDNFRVRYDEASGELSTGPLFIVVVGAGELATRTINPNYSSGFDIALRTIATEFACKVLFAGINEIPCNNFTRGQWLDELLSQLYLDASLKQANVFIEDVWTPTKVDDRKEIPSPGRGKILVETGPFIATHLHMLAVAIKGMILNLL